MVKEEFSIYIVSIALEGGRGGTWSQTRPD
jgi:hypothetical protein